MNDWRKSPSDVYTKLERIVRHFSGDKPEACYEASKRIWKRVKTAVRAESRKKSVKKRFDTAHRREIRRYVLSDIENSLKALSKKSIAKHIRPKDLAEVWKRLQGENMVEKIMNG
jgi:histidyl-tRNA synthetase